MITLIAILTFLLLAGGFRSVSLPVKAVLLNLLTLTSTLGFMVMFWQDGHGAKALFGVHATAAVTAPGRRRTRATLDGRRSTCKRRSGDLHST